MADEKESTYDRVLREIHAWREAHPVTDVLGSLTPGVSTLQGLSDVMDPSSGVLNRAIGGVSMIPGVSDARVGLKALHEGWKALEEVPHIGPYLRGAAERSGDALYDKIQDKTSDMFSGAVGDPTMAQLTLMGQQGISGALRKMQATTPGMWTAPIGDD